MTTLVQSFADYKRRVETLVPFEKALEIQQLGAAIQAELQLKDVQLFRVNEKIVGMLHDSTRLRDLFEEISIEIRSRDQTEFETAVLKFLSIIVEASRK